MDLLDVEHEVALLLEGPVALLAPKRRSVGRFRRCGDDRLRLVVERVLLLVEELGRDLVRLLLRLLYMRCEKRSDKRQSACIVLI